MVSQGLYGGVINTQLLRNAHPVQIIAEAPLVAGWLQGARLQVTSWSNARVPAGQHRVGAPLVAAHWVPSFRPTK